jgi:hypothetical protein
MVLVSREQLRFRKTKQSKIKQKKTTNDSSMRAQIGAGPVCDHMLAVDLIF